MTGNIKIKNDNLIFELHGIDKILSIKRSIIPSRLNMLFLFQLNM